MARQFKLLDVRGTLGGCDICTNSDRLGVETTSCLQFLRMDRPSTSTSTQKIHQGKTLVAEGERQAKPSSKRLQQNCVACVLQKLVEAADSARATRRPMSASIERP